MLVLLLVLLLGAFFDALKSEGCVDLFRSLKDGTWCSMVGVDVGTGGCWFGMEYVESAADAEEHVDEAI